MFVVVLDMLPTFGLRIAARKIALGSSYPSHPLRLQYIDVLDDWHE